MKKYEIKGWIMVFAFLFTLLFMVSCKTKQVVISKEKEQIEQTENQSEKTDNDVNQSVVSYQSENELKELKELISNLTIQYDGSELEDKLDILLKKSEDGTKISFSGKGTANYNESTKTEFESLKTELFKRQDSLFEQVLNSIKSYELELSKNHYSKDKEVKVTGFQFGIYAVLIIAVITFLVGYYVSRFVRKHLV